MRTSWTNAFASMPATAGVNGITTDVSIPVSAIRASRSSSVVIGSGARSGCSTRNHVGRLAVAERRRAVAVQADGRPAGQRGLDRPYPGPEVAVPVGQLAPRDRVWQGEGADPPADEAFDGGAAAQRRAEVGGERAHVGSLPAHDAERRPRPVDLLDRDRADDDLAGRALDFDALAR